MDQEENKNLALLGQNRTELMNCVDVLKFVPKGADDVTIESAWGTVIFFDDDENDSKVRLISLINFVTTISQLLSVPQPPLFLTRVKHDANGLYVSGGPKKYYPLGILKQFESLFVFKIEAQSYLPVEIINALEVCFRTKVSTNVYQIFEHEGQTVLLDRLAIFLKKNLGFLDDFTSVLTSKMLSAATVREQRTHNKKSNKIKLYTARKNLMDNVSGHQREVSIDAKHEAHTKIANADDKDIFIDALTAIMSIRQVSDEEGVGPQKINIHFEILRALRIAFLAQAQSTANPEWTSFGNAVIQEFTNYLDHPGGLLYIWEMKRGRAPDLAIVDHLKEFLVQIMRASIGLKMDVQSDGKIKCASRFGDSLAPCLVIESFAQKLLTLFGKGVFPEQSQLEQLTDDLLKEKVKTIILQSDIKNQAAFSFGQVKPSPQETFVHDAKNPTETGTAPTEFPLLEAIVEQMDTDSSYETEIKSRVYCPTIGDGVEVVFDSAVSVKLARIRIFEALADFIDVLKLDSNARTVVANMYLEYATKLRDDEQLDDARYQTMGFTAMWPLFLRRIKNTKTTLETQKLKASDDDDDAEGDEEKTSGPKLPVITDAAQIFSRKSDGFSTEGNGDEAAHILKNVIKNLASDILRSALVVGIGGMEFTNYEELIRPETIPCSEKVCTNRLS